MLLMPDHLPVLGLRELDRAQPSPLDPLQSGSLAIPPERVHILFRPRGGDKTERPLPRPTGPGRMSGWLGTCAALRCAASETGTEPQAAPRTSGLTATCCPISGRKAGRPGRGRWGATSSGRPPDGRPRKVSLSLPSDPPGPPGVDTHRAGGKRSAHCRGTSLPSQITRSGASRSTREMSVIQRSGFSRSGDLSSYAWAR
jgi:hypothetical protein